MVLLSSCGTEEPEVTTPSASDPATTPTEATPTDAAPTSAEPEETTEPTSEEPSESTTTSAEPTTEAPTTEEPTTEEPTSEAPTSTEPDEGAGDPATMGLEMVQEYAGLVTSGDIEGAYGMLSPESLVYYPDSEVFESNGVPGLAEDLSSASGEPQWAIRPAYEETHDSAQVVSVWGEDEVGGPFAYAWAVRKLDGSSWVIDQEITPSTGGPRLNWLNPGNPEFGEPWAVNPDSPIMFALLKKGGPNAAVTASIDDGQLGSQELVELPTDGSVMYEFSDSTIAEDGFSVATVSFVAEDDPFVHTSATPLGITSNG